MKTTLAIVIAVVVLWGTTSADTLRLKNGISITADRVTTKGDVVEYVIGSTTYRIPRADVDRIDVGGSFGIRIGAGQAPPASTPRTPTTINPKALASSTTAEKRQVVVGPPAPRAGVDEEAALLRRILNVGHVDDRALSAIEGEGDSSIAAAAYIVAAKYELKNNNAIAARVYASRAMELAPEDVSLMCWFSSLLLQSGESADAISLAERATRLAPKSAEPLRVLGAAYYQSDRLADAIQAWQHSQALQPDDVVQAYLTKAEREHAVEDSFREQVSSHFAVRFQGRRAGFSLTTDLLRTLERQYVELGRELGVTPQSSLTVILYTEREFFDVTLAPSWAGGLNDGKLRVPVKDVSEMNPELERILKHELAHSFIHVITGGKCPRWIDEGVAQMLEPRNSSLYGPALAELFRERHQAPLSGLEASFGGLSGAHAELAYAESLAAVEYLRSTYGMSGLRRILDRLGDGDSPEDAVRATTQSGYPELEKNVGAYLTKTYGP